MTWFGKVRNKSHLNGNATQIVNRFDKDKILVIKIKSNHKKKNLSQRLIQYIILISYKFRIKIAFI